MTSNLRKAYIANLITFILIAFSAIWMFSGLHFGNAPIVLEGQRLAMFKYYTVDSNVLMGIIALCASIMQRKVLKGSLQELPGWVNVMKLIGVVGVTLTMLVTIFFLTPTMGAYACFNNSNLFMHLINPIASIVTFLCFESSNTMAFKHTFTGVSSMIIYAIYYIAEAAIHSTNNIVNPGYDWYGFLVLGLNTAFIVVPLLILITYLISFALWKLNRKFYKS